MVDANGDLYDDLNSNSGLNFSISSASKLKKRKDMDNSVFDETEEETGKQRGALPLLLSDDSEDENRSADDKGGKLLKYKVLSSRNNFIFKFGEFWLFVLKLASIFLGNSHLKTNLRM